MRLLLACAAVVFTYLSMAKAACTSEGLQTCQPAIEMKLQSCEDNKCACSLLKDMVACFDSTDCGANSYVKGDYLDYVDSANKACNS